MTEKEREKIRSGHVRLYQATVDLQRDAYHCVDADSQFWEELNRIREAVTKLDTFIRALYTGGARK